MVDSRRNCGCTPGALESGWQENRSEPCVRAELAQWEGLLERVQADMAAMTRREG